MTSIYHRIFVSAGFQAFVLQATFVLFFVELFSNIRGYGPIRFAGFQPQDAALMLCVGYLSIVDRDFWEKITSKLSLYYLGAIALYAFVGFAYGNSVGWIRTDVRFFMWVYGGYAFVCLWWQTARPLLHLHIMQAALLMLLYFSAIQAHNNHFSNATFVEGRDRLYGLNLFVVGAAMLPFLGIHYTIFAPRSRLALLSAAVVSAVYIYYVLYLSATRNLLLSYLMLSAACLPIFIYRLRGGFFDRAIVAPRIVLLVISVLGLSVFVASRFDSLLIFERFEGGDLMRDHSARGRVVELERVLERFDNQKLITGGGLGTTFRPTGSYEANFLHFGIAGVVLKVGLPVGIVLTLFLFGFIPLLLLTAFLWPSAFTPEYRTAIYAAFPLLFPWLVQLAISGGFMPLHSLGVGMALGVAQNIIWGGLFPEYESEEAPAMNHHLHQAA